MYFFMCVLNLYIDIPLIWERTLIDIEILNPIETERSLKSAFLMTIFLMERERFVGGEREREGSRGREILWKMRWGKKRKKMSWEKRRREWWGRKPFSKNNDLSTADGRLCNLKQYGVVTASVTSIYNPFSKKIKIFICI